MKYGFSITPKMLPNGSMTLPLVELLSENLTDAKVYRIGRINLAVLIVGRSFAGILMGLLVNHISFSLRRTTHAIL